MISACTAAGDTDSSLKNVKKYLIGKEKSRVKDGRVLAHLELCVIQAQFHIIGGTSPFQFWAASRKLVFAYHRWLQYAIYLMMKACTSQLFLPCDHKSASLRSKRFCAV